MRLVNILAKLYLVLSLAGAVSPAYAFERGVDERDSSPTPKAIGLQVLRASFLPAKTAASPEGARTNIAAARRSLQLHPGIVPGGILVPAVVLSGILALAFGASFAPVPFPSSSVRGPPLAL